MLPPAVTAGLESALGEAIADVRAVAGGCISNASRLRTQSGKDYFLKWGDHPAMFAAEADALAVIRATNTVRVPAVIAVEEWLLAEWLEPGAMTSSEWERLGEALAGMHRHRSEAFGWKDSNFIGTLSQANPLSHDWPQFWRDARILPQAAVLAADHRRRVDKLLDFVQEELSAGNREGPSLLHGDLWGGNVHGVHDGRAAVIDPSSYYGHREVDLAMATLFGGFDARFFDAYNAAWPLEPGFERRRLFYQLYYMLVHVNLFGAAYLSRTMSLVGKLGF